MAKGNDAKIQTLKDNLRVVTLITPPSVGSTPLYLALFVTNPGADGSGTEVSYVDYARQEIQFDDDPTVPVGSAVAEILNTNDIEFATVPSNSGNCAYAAIMTTNVAGDGEEPVYYGPLGATYALNVGVKPTVPIGGLTVYEN
jgi:hypothetical protein